MVVHRTAFWLLLIVCSVVGAACMLANDARRTGDDGRLARIERLVAAGLTGVGLGMSVAALMLLLAALIVRLEG